MFYCINCKKHEMKYKGEGRYECDNCGHVRQQEQEEFRCYSCKRRLKRWTWFDPSHCPYCNYSFVD